MEQPQFEESGQNAFYGDFLFSQIVSKDHFLRQLRQVIPWEHYTKKLISLYEDGEVPGSLPYNPALLLRMEFLAYLYNLSEQQVETFVNENLPAKYFVGQAVIEAAPHHSTLTAFRERLKKKAKWELFESMLQDLIKIALEKGVQFGSIKIVDSVHGAANANVPKDE